MLKRFLPAFIILSALLLMLPSAVSAQPPATWEVTLFDPETGTVNRITSGGIFQLGVLPNVSQLGSSGWRAKLTPDGHYLIFDTYLDNGGQNVYVADLQTQTCCRLLEDPLNAGLDIDWIGPISPDGTRVAVATSSMSLFMEGQINFTPLVTIFDIATGNVLNSMAISDLVSEFPAPIAEFGGWQADGIRLSPSCLGCEGIWKGDWQIWDPDANTLSPPIEPFDVFRDELPATGEFIMGNADEFFPSSGMPGGYFLPANIVEYYTDAYAFPQAVYFRQDNLYINRAEWVADGHAILVIHAGPLEMTPEGFPNPGEFGPSYVIFRNGSQIPVSMPITSRNFLAGVPNGWLTQDWDTGLISYYRLDANNTIQSVPLGTAKGVQVGQNFTLGATAAGAFPVVSPPAPVVCPGFINSRLAANSVAMVTTGPPNNVRLDPSLNATLLGEIPGDGMFLVLAGPVCANNMAWWQVNYQGLIGWTSEGQGTDYWLVPGLGY